jgi:HSP20 family protein
MKVKNNALVPGFFNLMDKFMTDDFQTPAQYSRPAVNIVETEKSYALEVIAPGMKKEDFKIAIEKDLLTISYEKKESSEEKTDKYIRKEFSMNSFKRSFTLNEKLNAEGVTAKYENGVLHVNIPKAEVKTVEVKTVEIN